MPGGVGGNERRDDPFDVELVALVGVGRIARVKPKTETIFSRTLTGHQNQGMNRTMPALATMTARLERNHNLISGCWSCRETIEKVKNPSGLFSPKGAKDRDPVTRYSRAPSRPLHAGGGAKCARG
jgi:hypothetical protein